MKSSSGCHSSQDRNYSALLQKHKTCRLDGNGKYGVGISAASSRRVQLSKNRFDAWNVGLVAFVQYWDGEILGKRTRAMCANNLLCLHCHREVLFVRICRNEPNTYSFTFSDSRVQWPSIVVLLFSFRDLKKFLVSVKCQPVLEKLFPKLFAPL